MIPTGSDVTVDTILNVGSTNIFKLPREEITFTVKKDEVYFKDKKVPYKNFVKFLLADGSYKNIRGLCSECSGEFEGEGT